MKFADKLKAVLAANPQIQRNREIIRRMYYLQKTNPKKYEVKFDHFEKEVVFRLWEKLGFDHLVQSVNCAPFSSYELPTDKESKAAEVAEKLIKAVKKVFKSKSK